MLALAVMMPWAPCTAQRVATTIGAGSEHERYLRVLSLAGDVIAPQWTVRRFTPRELDGMKVAAGNDVWAAHVTERAGDGFAVTAPWTALRFNSSFPYGFNDGPVWAGKGATVAAGGGAMFRAHGFSLELNPVVFLAQNAAFKMEPTGYTGGQAFSDWRNPVSIDLPQRFGPQSYGRFDPGESHIQFDARWLSAGVTTESDVWGPALEHPIILGNNAGGFPRIFAGTSSPLAVGWLRMHGRVIWGRLDQSSYGWPTGDKRRHFATAAVGSMAFAGVPGLELGAARFYHLAWPSSLGDVPWLRVFQGVLKNSLGTAANPTGDSPDNQLASVFFRWAPPRAGIEVYGEYGREDHNADVRDLAKEPDHDAAFSLGVQRAWKRAGGLIAVRGELLNTRLSHLQQSAPQTPWYVHGQVNQGHTYRGQVLGSVAGYGGGGSTLALDRYSPAGRITVRWDRLMQAEMRSALGMPVSDRADVIHAIGVERVRFRGRLELTHTAFIMKEFNRHFGADAYNLTLTTSVRLAH